MRPELISQRAEAGLRPLIPAAKIQRRVAELGAEISRAYLLPRSEPVRLVGVLKGAFVFLADLVRVLEFDVSVDFLSLRSYGDQAFSSNEVTIFQDLEHDIKGLDVLVVEDIVDTGLTLDFLRRELERREPRSLRVVALLDKPARRTTPVQLDYRGFEVPDEFIVGYGLDFAQRYRHLPDLCVLDPETE